MHLNLWILSINAYRHASWNAFVLLGMASDTVRGVSWVQTRGLVMWSRTLLLLTSMVVGREILLGTIAASQGCRSRWGGRRNKRRRERLVAGVYDLRMSAMADRRPVGVPPSVDDMQYGRVMGMTMKLFPGNASIGSDVKL